MDIDYGTLELINTRPRLRDDLIFSEQTHQQQSVYVLEDPVRSKFFRIGLPEYRFIQHLNGCRTVGYALSQTAKELGKNALTEHDAATILHFLYENELASQASEAGQAAIQKKRHQLNDQNLLKKLNLLFLKMPLFNPDAFLSGIEPKMRWMLGKSFLYTWLAVLLSAAFILMTHTDQLSVSSTNIFSMNNWFWLIIAWLALKMIHELFHGLVCKFYGGKVYEAGVIWILFAPIGYVDATSSWMFKSKWQRMHTAAAGMYIEIFIAAIFAWIWFFSSYGPIKELAYNIIVLASITTLLFNANPLMKFDGYYIFSDYVEIPNLYGEGTRYVTYLAKKYLLGIDVNYAAQPGKAGKIIKIYGVCALIWRLFVIATILIIASNLFHGAGLMLVMLSSIVMFGIPLIKLFNYLRHGNDFEKPNAAMAILRVGLLVTVSIILLTQIKFKHDITAPMVVDFAETENVYPRSEGFVSQLFVENGQFIEAGKPILQLTNDALQTQVKILTAKLRQLSIKRNNMMLAKQITQLQAMDEKIRFARAELNMKRDLLKSLKIKAKTSGIISFNDDYSMLGQYISKKQLIANIVSTDDKIINSLFHNQFFEHIRNKEGAAANIFINGKRFPAQIAEIAPKASYQITSPALTTMADGDLVVHQTENTGYELLNAYVEVKIKLKQASQLQSGQTGWVEVSGNAVSLSEFWNDKVSGWVKSIIKQI